MDSSCGVGCGGVADGGHVVVGCGVGQVKKVWKAHWPALVGGLFFAPSYKGLMWLGLDELRSWVIALFLSTLSGLSIYHWRELREWRRSNSDESNR